MATSTKGQPFTTTNPQESKIKWTIHAEVRLQSRAAPRFETIRNCVHAYIMSFDAIALPSTLKKWESISELASSVEQIIICESSCPFPTLNTKDINLQVHVYQPSDSESFEEFAAASGSQDDDDSMAATVCELPNRLWNGLWDSLIYNDDIKMKLLDYIHATLIFSDANVDFNLVSWNRVVLLHGPPGTGKTSLCRALAQKLSIRLSHRYTHARLLEINSHSLFSKWFSESGKLVQRLFNSITELVEEEDGFLVVLIVESLTAARAGAMAGTEPSDGLRVVNALLTQLDKLKHRKNVLIMSTSNLVKAIDSAFVDRADIIQYVDLPSQNAIYNILRTSLCEIITKGIVAPINVPPIAEAHWSKTTIDLSQPTSDDPQKRAAHLAVRLLLLSAKCKEQGISGRALRRLPVLALARHIGIGQLASSDVNAGTPAEAWLDGMEKVVKQRSEELKELN